MQDTAIPKKDVVRKAICNKTKRKAKNEVAGWRVHGPEEDGFTSKWMERQSKESRGLEAHCRGGQGPPRAVAPSGGRGLLQHKIFSPFHYLITDFDCVTPSDSEECTCCSICGATWLIKSDLVQCCISKCFPKWPRKEINKCITYKLGQIWVKTCFREEKKSFKRFRHFLC